MAWNEPGGNDQDPWGGKRKNNDGPPDLDEALKNFQNKINQLFGGKGGSNRSSGGGAGFFSGGLMIVALVVALGLLAFNSFYVIDEKERAVVLRLGVYNDTKDPGLHIILPLINKVFIVNTTEIRDYSTGGLMLTQDESIVELPVTVQYNITNVKDFILNVRDPVVSLQHATDSALRHVVGSSELDQVLGEGRNVLGEELRARLQTYLESYGTGINIVGINIRKGEPPSEVKEAFDDVINAKEDQERLKNQAQAYANEIVPVARGAAQRAIEEANAYRERVVAKAEGEADRFNKILNEYSKAPEVTRERLYLDAVEEVMTKSTKIMVDVKDGNNLLYLPLDKLVAQPESSTSNNPTNTLSPGTVRQITDSVTEQLQRDNKLRRKEVR
jgi:modulator of FtsH protease HflK